MIKIVENEMEIMDKVIQALGNDNFNENQMNELLLGINQKLAEREKSPKLKKELEKYSEQLSKVVTHSNTMRINVALNSLRENFKNDQRIERDTLPNIEIIKDANIKFTPDEKLFLKWLENIMSIQKGKPYKIKAITEPEKPTEIKEKISTEEVFKMNNKNLEPGLLRSIAQKGILNSYAITDIEYRLDKDVESITSILKQIIPAGKWNIVKHIVDTINQRDNEHKQRARELY